MSNLAVTASRSPAGAAVREGAKPATQADAEAEVRKLGAGRVRLSDEDVHDVATRALEIAAAEPGLTLSAAVRAAWSELAGA